MRRLKLATRGSQLALWQANKVASLLEAFQELTVELVIVKTQGDRNQEVALGDAGSVGLFTSEVQQAVLQDQSDLAVHSLKDLPAQQTPGLRLAAIPERANAADVLLIHPQAWDPDQPELPLKRNAIVGTSAARRKAFLVDLRPDCKPALLRGNVPTRVAKLQDGKYDAILAAAAGLERLQLDLNDLHNFELDLQRWPCAPGQGALAVECKVEDEDLQECLRKIHQPQVAQEVEVERKLLRALGGGCGLPLGARAWLKQDHWELSAALGPTEERPSTEELIRVHLRKPQAKTLIETARGHLLQEQTA